MTPPNLLPPLVPQWRHWNVGRVLRRTQRIGQAKLEPFTITRDMELHHRMRAELNPKEGGRWVPAGRYTALKLCRDHFDDEECWRVVMSDTPDEMNDHADVLLNASGRVLVHGLGLGCVLNCLIHNPAVTHIDVVEVDSDVLALMVPIYAPEAEALGRGLEFHEGSCVEIRWPRGTRWNYVWHDIWSEINEDNLSDDAKAEHGISYARLHRMFGHRCDRQGSWALREARWKRDVERHVEHLAAVWTFRYNRATPAERLDMLIERQAMGLFGGGAVSPSEWRELMRKAMPERLAQLAAMAEEKIALDDARWMVLDEGRMLMPRRKARADAKLIREHAA